MNDHWQNLTYCKNWMNIPRKKPKYVKYQLCADTRRAENKLFLFSLQAPMNYPYPTQAIYISLDLGPSVFVKEFNAIWVEYCNLGFSLDEKLKYEKLKEEVRKIA
jgi:hypothetical protein